ncbi:hypothetical protein P9597_25850 [Aneurinibacillus migulanus]|uniref:hypothetical protein n=1 Tax=Aneurinibacillus migulanus TaxID=47500 RepID=UPI002E1BFEDD|nr:hypothetical protein [Aneurinibacillus migulanus]
MKKIALIGVTTALLFLSACGEKPITQKTNEQPKQASIKHEKPSSEPSAKNEDNKTVTTLPNGVIETTVGNVTTYSNDKIYTYYKGANWEGNHNGLKTEVVHVALTDKYPLKDGKLASVVNVKFKLHNTTQGKFTTYPDQAQLITSTGEKIESPTFKSENIGGEIDKGATKEGILYFQLEKGNADKINWIQLFWPVSDNGTEQRIVLYLNE